MSTGHYIQKQQNTHSAVQGMLSRIDHMLGHKINLNKFKRIDMNSRIFSEHNCMKLEISYIKNNGKITNTWRLNSVLLKIQWVNK